MLPQDLNGRRIHMVGIKGTGMAALAELLHARGAVITGSDVSDVFYTDEILQKLNIPYASSFAARHIDDSIDFVIHSSAYSTQKNPELAEAARKGLPTLLYTEALGEFSALSYSCGVCGVHGKTTTAALAGTIVHALGLPAQTLAGSAVPTFNDNCTISDGAKYFIAETCEYQKHFLSFKPRKIILTSIESDHQDYYPTYEAILSAFMQYIDLLPENGEIFYCADNAGACEAIKMIYSSRPDLIYTPYGETATGEYKTTIKGARDRRLAFTLAGLSGEFTLRIPGAHNALNAAAAIALAVSLLKKENGAVSGRDIETIREAVASFRGTRRRAEIIGEAAGILFMDDYGHHPTAVRSTLAGLKEFFPGRRLVVDFMSHTYSRTEALLDDFAASFDDADVLILHKIYGSAREQYTGTVTGRMLYEKIKRGRDGVYYFHDFSKAENFLNDALRAGDVFITMGAGDNWKLGRALFNNFKAKEEQSSGARGI